MIFFILEMVLNDFDEITLATVGWLSVDDTSSRCDGVAWGLACVSSKKCEIWARNPKWKSRTNFLSFSVSPVSIWDRSGRYLWSNFRWWFTRVRRGGGKGGWVGKIVKYSGMTDNRSFNKKHEQTNNILVFFCATCLKLVQEALENNRWVLGFGKIIIQFLKNLSNKRDPCEKHDNKSTISIF